MKNETMFVCFYCDSEDTAGFVCSECEVNKCEECFSRIERDEAVCVECLQYSSLFANNSFVIQVVSSLDPSPGKRISYFEGTDFQGTFAQAVHFLKQTLPGKHSEIVIRVHQPLSGG